MTEGKRLAIGVFCADWRLHQDVVHLNKQVAQHLGVDGIDELSVAGPEGVLANPTRKESLRLDLEVLIGAHHPVAIAFLAHQRCAGHPVSDEEHEQDVQTLMKSYKDLLGFKGEMVALVVTYERDDAWGLKEVGRIPAK